ncbi:MAG: enoyl-CoA hydratase/isomerase family protein, partial [Proteobacteria bacterium]|nr:enoyl-CoA hydratase/isomerase family protein [Pseudomonadota bacterium]
MNETVLLSNVGSTAVITLNRPEKLNAWDTPMREALAEMLRE